MKALKPWIPESHASLPEGRRIVHASDLKSNYLAPLEMAEALLARGVKHETHLRVVNSRVGIKGLEIFFFPLMGFWGSFAICRNENENERKF